nr:hypothetical protein [uncultured Celeribacter sp.]
MTRRLICVERGCEDLAELGGNRFARHAEAQVRRVAESKARAQMGTQAAAWRKRLNETARFAGRSGDFVFSWRPA